MLHLTSIGIVFQKTFQRPLGDKVENRIMNRLCTTVPVKGQQVADKEYCLKMAGVQELPEPWGCRNNIQI